MVLLLKGKIQCIHYEIRYIQRWPEQVTVNRHSEKTEERNVPRPNILV
jgi:hypothetical protein